jgi:hypothetical protein
MKQRIIPFVIALLTVIDASATDLLISRGLYQGNYYTRGLGTYDWHDTTALLNQNANLTPTYVLNLEDNSQVMAADAIWINERWTSGRLSATEMNNLSQFIATGRKVVFIGENNNWKAWNDQFLSLVGVTTDPVSHFWWSWEPIPLVQNTLTFGISNLDITEGGVPLGGLPLFTGGVVSLFGPSQNVLAVLDSNVYEGNLSPFAGHEQFAYNTLQWIAQVPEPSASSMCGGGLVLIAFVATLLSREKTTLDRTRPNQITGANSRCAGQLAGYWSYNAVVASASALPAAVAQFCRSASTFLW